MDPVRVAVVGVGFMGEQHVAAYARNLGARLVAVVDVREGAARRVAKEYGVESYADVQTMLADADASAVSICTNDERHVEPTLLCLEARKHVLLEKPIATTVEDADTIIRAAEAAGTKFLVGHLLRFNPQYRHVKERVAAGDLGGLKAVFMRRLNHVGLQQVLRGRVSVLSFLGIHDFDYLLWLSGVHPARLYTEATYGIHGAAGHDIEDHTFTVIRFSNGLIACVEAGWVLPDSHPRKADFKLEVIGTRGMAQVDLTSGELALCAERGWEIPRLGHDIDAEVAHFLDCILKDERPLVSGEDAREALRLSLAAQESAKSGKVIELEGHPENRPV